MLGRLLALQPAGLVLRLIWPSRHRRQRRQHLSITGPGFYVGLNAGGGWGSNKIDNSFAPGTCNAGFCSLFFTALNTAIPGQFDIDPSGFIGGGQIGYNYQFASSWVAGLEADFQGANIKGDANAANAGMFILGVPNTFQVTGAASQKLGSVPT